MMLVVVVVVVVVGGESMWFEGMAAVESRGGVSLVAGDASWSYVESVSELDSSASHSSKMARSSASVLKRRIPWPRSLMLGLRIHHSLSSGVLSSLRAKLSWSS